MTGPAPTPLLLGHEIYRASSYGGWHPLRIPRVSTVMDLTRALGWVAPGQYRRSPRAKPVAVTLFHDPDYVAALVAAEAAQDVSDAVRQRHGLGTTACPVFPEMWRRPATSAGGSLLAGELLRTPGVIHHPAGGTHHAFRDRAAGFCYLNDPVLAMLAMRRAGVRRIVYVDIDAHHADGVESAFAGDPDIRMISVHEERRWPFTGALDDTAGGSAINLPVPKGFNDTEFTFVVNELILPATAAFRPEAIVLQCGADAVEEDPLSRLALSNRAHWSAVAALRALTDRFLVLGGGGYNPWSVGRLWTGVWGVLNGHEIPDRLPPEAEAVLRALRWENRRAGRAPPAHWFTTLADRPRPGPLRDELRTRVATLRRRVGTGAVLAG